MKQNERYMDCVLPAVISATSQTDIVGLIDRVRDLR